MTKKTQVIAALSFVLLLISGVAVWYVSFEVERIGDELTIQVQRLANQRAQAEQLGELLALVQATEADRNQLQSFLLSEADTITFLADIERIGSQQGVALTTNSLDVTKVDDTSVLTAAFSIIGPQDLVLRMLTILENLPYESELTRLNITYGSPAELTVVLTLTLY